MIRLSDKQSTKPQTEVEQPVPSVGKGNKPQSISPVEPDPSVEAPKLVSLKESFEGITARRNQPQQEGGK